MSTTSESASAYADDNALVEALRSGSDRAYEELVRTYAGRMLAVTRRILRDEDEARDALQEAFISAYKAIGKFKGESALSTWLHRIAVNAALMRQRSRKRRSEEPIEKFLPSYDDRGHREIPDDDWRHASDKVIERKQTSALVRSLIDQLPDSHRTVLILRDIEELSTNEAARALNITPNAVKVRLHRARQALRELLNPHVSASGAGGATA